jgi:hypothetical protein
MNTQDLHVIKVVAIRLRDVLGFCNLDCRPYAQTLVQVLRLLGYPAQRVYGWVRVDGNWDGGDWGVPPVAWKGELDEDGQPKGFDENLDHNWVVVNDLLIDIGAEQFNPLIRGKKFPAVYIARFDQAPRHAAGEIMPWEDDLPPPGWSPRGQRL